MNDLERYVRTFPRVVRIEPAGACNLKCSHCPTGTVDMTRGVMQPETFSLVMETIRAHAGSVHVVVLYHGGEPLLNKRFGEMVKEVKGAGIPFVKAVSNGMLLTEATLAGLVTGGLDSIEFSLDGESPEQNNFIRRECDYDTVVRNIKRLMDEKRARGSVTPKVFIASTQFVEKATFRAGQEPAAPGYLLREFSGEYAGEIAGFKCTYAVRWPHMEVLGDVYDLFEDPFDTETRNTCDHVENTVTVRWNGDVVACCYDLTSRYVLGNVHREGLATIWNSRKYLALRRSIEERKFIPMCANCSVVTPNVYLTLTPRALAAAAAGGTGEGSRG